VARSKTGQAPGALAGGRVGQGLGDLAASQGGPGVPRWAEGHRLERSTRGDSGLHQSLASVVPGHGAEGLRDAERPGPTPRLSESEKAELATIIEAGPQAAGFTSGMWTGPMIGDLIRRRFGVHYHNHHIPRLLGWMGFSVQRPRKRLARADAEAQAVWLRHRLPAIKKKVLPVIPGEAGDSEERKGHRQPLW
jgi:transposase